MFIKNRPRAEVRGTNQMMLVGSGYPPAIPSKERLPSRMARFAMWFGLASLDY